MTMFPTTDDWFDLATAKAVARRRFLRRRKALARAKAVRQPAGWRSAEVSILDPLDASDDHAFLRGLLRL